VPNLLPVLVALGLTGWFDVPLRIGIAMIFSLGLGLAVDDSIHLLTRYREETRRAPGRPVRASITRALRSTGVALITTSLVLLVGSLCYLPSEFRSMRDVGFLLSAMVTTALVADLWLLPHMLERFGPKAPAPTAGREGATTSS